MRHQLRVVRAHALAWIGFVRLVAAITRGRVDQVWVGDSNAVFFGSDRFPPLGLGTTTERRWVWHLGPRLMFSTSRTGFRPGLHRALRFLGRLPNNRKVVWVFSFGEIDIRCHLAPRVKEGDRLDFIGGFVARIQGLVADLRLPFGVYVLPVPPATERFDHEFFPVVGTNEERLAAHGVVRKRLLQELAAVSTSPPVLALDLTDEIADDDGWYRPEMHVDGVHPSAAAREVAQARLRRLLADNA